MSESKATYAVRCTAHVVFYVALAYLYSLSTAYYVPDIVDGFAGYALLQPATVAVVMIVAVGIGYKGAKDVPSHDHE